jgi:23S rRNA (adenine2030-N6)-methyltransferase
MLRAELLVDAAVAGRLYGSGMILVNPPFVLEDELKSILPALVKALAAGRGSHRVEWVRGEG